ncbi:protein CapL [Thermoclostridium stercorarium subsp. stercorarium DSM 8532]|jgi:UDP-N-acetyl-D-galactosamine dehydrogenase|uniref:Protein CapL n=3 Tax=Thermoclostridium stercorarium TaxID=1510 RepID=L7VKD9_THES1|nr:nucleotide sugar dehydrogenase [Thermoclostridium stercorarium]AGC67192.1 protein CapL [Thermoclostridium stercorarium subsp. stercorarium DSM 8532]AGI38270.1 nucleotide sugar dehydrogenase [Thermoclostridium stercorarium subsp. stercorarium DSM 8532]ANW97663.1 UDP-N-acetyl-D-galactosamine dehydrogenase [Thermoclostridium stercorarium subsp. thermolacticum DSM 2910]ANX00225.1 UDP-N-acetyl-D-galactosamine dehydrogenase [Thermoclostridium stercorarium subsp. leptospartum DSM 9219]
MGIYNDLLDRKKNLAVVGLGYVGMPLAIEFGKKINVIGFDTDKRKIENYLNGIDVTGEVGNEALKNTTVEFSSDEGVLSRASFYIVTVPTPVAQDKTPDLNPLIGASTSVGRHLKKGDYVVYESTVYPGVTEEICIPVLERESGLKAGTDFKVGYSPERINPGDKVHTVTKVLKIVSGIDEEALEEIAKVYGIIVEAGIYRAESIKVAEAAKVIENTQRDINIAFMNELSIIFNKMNINTKAVLEAAGTKWNFLKFTPGLVGGHCIGVDPYYLAYKAQQLGYHPEVILAGRRINDMMGKYVAENTVKQLIKADKQIKGARVFIMGLTFKEDVPDTRNTKVVDIVHELQEYGIEVFVSDYMANSEDVLDEYGIKLAEYDDVNNVDAVIMAVCHKKYREITLDMLEKKYSKGTKVLIDVKGMFSPKEAAEKGYLYWSL